MIHDSRDAIFLLRHASLYDYCFFVNMTFEQTIRESSVVDGQQISRETVADRFSFCREICMVTLDKRFEKEGLFGDVGEMIEIDECKICRRKYENMLLRNRGFSE